RPPEAVEQPSPQLPLQLGHVLRERRLAQVQDLGPAAEALRPSHGQEDLELPEAELHKPDLIEETRTHDWPLYNPSAYRWRQTKSPSRRGAHDLPRVPRSQDRLRQLS